MTNTISQVNIYQGSQTTIKMQIFDENQLPRDLVDIDTFSFIVAKKSDNKLILDSEKIYDDEDRKDAICLFKDKLNSAIEITVNQQSLSSLTPQDAGVPLGRQHIPTPTLWGYITLKKADEVVDKIYIPDIAIYFEPIAP